MCRFPKRAINAYPPPMHCFNKISHVFIRAIPFIAITAGLFAYPGVLFVYTKLSHYPFSFRRSCKNHLLWVALYNQQITRLPPTDTPFRSRNPDTSQPFRRPCAYIGRSFRDTTPHHFGNRSHHSVCNPCGQPSFLLSPSLQKPSAPSHNLPSSQDSKR